MTDRRLTGDEPGGGPQSLHVGVVVRTATSWPLFVAEHLGYFRANGLSVTVTASGDPETQFRRLRDGTYHITHQNADHALRALADGADIRILMRLMRALSFLVTAPDVPDYAALRGRPVVVEAADSIHGVVLRRMLAANGLEDGACPLRDAASSRERMRWMRENRASAALVEPSAAARLVHDGYRVLDTSWPYIGGHLWSVAVAGREWIEGHRDAAARYVASYAAAAAWLAQPGNGAEAAAVLSAAIDIPPDVARTAHQLMAASGSVFDPRSAVTADELSRLARASDATRALDASGALASLVDRRVLRDAMALSHGRADGATAASSPD